MSRTKNHRTLQQEKTDLSLNYLPNERTLLQSKYNIHKSILHILPAPDLSVIQSRLHTSLANKTRSALTIHLSLRSNLIEPCNFLDGRNDEVDDILVVDVCVVDITSSLRAECTSSVLDELGLVSACSYGPCATAYIIRLVPCFRVIRGKG
jgi:hypothetical protein